MGVVVLTFVSVLAFVLSVALSGSVGFGACTVCKLVC